MSSAPSGWSIPEPGDRIRIRYLRPPDREQVFEQFLIASEPGTFVTLLEAVELAQPSRVDGAAILEPGSPIVWFTFAGAQHDIGRFHRADGTFTGLYANVLTPVDGLDGAEWRTTDLFLDLWQPISGDATLLDEAELDDALARGWLDAATVAAARAEARRLLEDMRAGSWPPPIVDDWPLERARAALRHTRRRIV